MQIRSQYLFMVSMDVEPDKEDLFNEVYDQEHIPSLMKVPGVHGAVRVKGEAFAVMMAGERKEVSATSPVYTAIYEIDGPEVLTSPEWAEAVEEGRWPSQVRPFTTNRRQVLAKLV